MADVLFGDPDLDAYGANLVMAHKFDDGSGSLTDSTGNGYDGAVTGSLTYHYTPAMNNYAVSMDNTAVANCGAIGGAVFPTQEFTSAGWYRLDNTGQTYYYLYTAANLTDPYFRLRCRTDGGGVVYFDGGGKFGGNCLARTCPEISDYDWHLIVITRDTSNVYKLYIDNVYKGPSWFPGASSPNGRTWRFFTSRSDDTVTGEMYGGKMDEVWLWNALLDADALTALWNGGSGQFLEVFQESHLSCLRDTRTNKLTQVDA